MIPANNKFIGTANEEIFYFAGNPVSLDRDDVDTLKRIARQTARQRARICMHPDIGDPLHEMLILHCRNAYVRPHKHPGKSESLHVVEGEADIVVFDDGGTVRHVIPIGLPATGKTFYYRLNSSFFHTLIIRTDVFLFHETTNGPFRREDTVFAPWAPAENDSEAIEHFLTRDFTSPGKTL
ncbi:MAG TPA: WbuC family cupin fold metalloprotein [Novimethylophilus sp.]|jgi:cupin fold WbuC family metalloprotein|uniref:WbuC family cupin fold metalloprotein n=1 Tax=Novimethylophilus sp. TaxID=2137426 RepID=UPI002F3F106A